MRSTQGLVSYLRMLISFAYVKENGIAFIGPSAEVIDSMGINQTQEKQ